MSALGQKRTLKQPCDIRRNPRRLAKAAFVATQSNLLRVDNKASFCLPTRRGRTWQKSQGWFLAPQLPPRASQHQHWRHTRASQYPLIGVNMSPEAAKEAAFTPRHRLRNMIQERGRMTAGCSERHITPPIASAAVAALSRAISRIVAKRT
jgi:hypothetical protein